MQLDPWTMEADALWDFIMAEYYADGQWIDQFNDLIIGGSLGIPLQGMETILSSDFLCCDTGDEFFGALGKIADGVGALFDVANLGGKQMAIFSALQSGEVEITGRQLLYLNTRAIAELEFALGAAVGTGSLSTGMALVASVAELGVDISGDSINERLAEAYTYSLFSLNTGSEYGINSHSIRSITFPAMATTYSMIYNLNR